MIIRSQHERQSHTFWAPQQALFHVF
jgi:hypothetical protein